jgi:hypothetical protein
MMVIFIEYGFDYLLVADLIIDILLCVEHQETLLLLIIGQIVVILEKFIDAFPLFF